MHNSLLEELNKDFHTPKGVLWQSDNDCDDNLLLYHNTIIAICKMQRTG